MYHPQTCDDKIPPFIINTHPEGFIFFECRLVGQSSSRKPKREILLTNDLKLETINEKLEMVPYLYGSKESAIQQIKIARNTMYEKVCVAKINKLDTKLDACIVIGCLRLLICRYCGNYMEYQTNTEYAKFKLINKVSRDYEVKDNEVLRLYCMKCGQWAHDKCIKEQQQKCMDEEKQNPSDIPSYLERRQQQTYQIPSKITIYWTLIQPKECGICMDFISQAKKGILFIYYVYIVCILFTYYLHIIYILFTYY